MVHGVSDVCGICLFHIHFRAKCGNGFDDATLEKLQEELKPNMTKIAKNPSQIPKWISISRELTPDFVVIDPKKSPVWEITVTNSRILTQSSIVQILFLGCGIFQIQTTYCQWNIYSISSCYQSSRG